MKLSSSKEATETTGQRLRRHRGKKTQTEVATATGISRNSLRRYENGERDPPLKVVERLARFYGVAAGDLVASAPKQTQPTIADTEDVATRLQRAKQLHQQKMITADEYAEIRARILDTI